MAKYLIIIFEYNIFSPNFLYQSLIFLSWYDLTHVDLFSTKFCLKGKLCFICWFAKKIRFLIKGEGGLLIVIFFWQGGRGQVNFIDSILSILSSYLHWVYMMLAHFPLILFFGNFALFPIYACEGRVKKPRLFIHILLIKYCFKNWFLLFYIQCVI